MKMKKPEVILLAFSALLSAAIAVSMFEYVENARYEKWKEKHSKSIEWFGGITIASDDPELMWEYKSNASTTDKFTRETGLSIQTNNIGFRDDDFSIEKTDEVSRYAFIGDSVTIGLYVDVEHLFVNVLEKQVDSSSRIAIEAMNFGVDGYNTRQIRHLLEKRAAKFGPEVVVYVLCWNDFDFDNASGDKIKYFRKPKSFFWEALKKASDRLAGYSADEWQEVNYHQFYYKKNKAKVIEEIVKMKSFTESIGADFLVALVPIFPRSTNSFDNYPINDLHEDFSKNLSVNAIETVDLLNAFLDSGAPIDQVSRDIWHLNEMGHQTVGLEFYRILLDGSGH